jgi:hypothetical protein
MSSVKKILKKRDLTLYHSEKLNCWLQLEYEASKFKWGDVFASGVSMRLLLELSNLGVIVGYEKEDIKCNDIHRRTCISLSCKKEGLFHKDNKYNRCSKCEYINNGCDIITEKYFEDFEFYGEVKVDRYFNYQLFKFNNVLDIKIRKSPKKEITDENGRYEFFKDHEGGTWIRCISKKRLFPIKWLFTTNPIKFIKEQYVKDLFKLTGDLR